jgi:hypothetical protein
MSQSETTAKPEEILPQETLRPPEGLSWAERLAARAAAEDILKATPRGLIIAMSIHAMLRGSQIGTLSQTPTDMLDHVADVAIDIADAVQRAQERRVKK